MKNKATNLVLFSIVSTMLLSACGNSDTKSTLSDINSMKATESNGEVASEDNSDRLSNNAVTEAVDSEFNNSTDTSLTDETDGGVIGRGTWFILDGDVSIGYISLNDNSTDGIFYDFRDTSDSVFDYEYSGNVFTFNIEGESYSGELVQSDEATYELKISDSESWSIQFVSDKNSSNFRFYTADELCSMALDYYEVNYSYRPSGVSYINNTDQTITIHLFDDYDDQTSMWYTVDRITATGVEELSGKEVCLTDYDKDAIPERKEK